MKTYGVGVVGVGVWGCHSLERELAGTGRAKIVAMCGGEEWGANCHGDQLPAKLAAYAAEVGAELAADWRAVVARPDVDIISAMVCPQWKAEVIEAALRHGKHVVTDKPLGLFPAEARRIRQAEGESAGRGFMLAGYQRRPGVRRLMAAAEAGELGELKSLSLRLNFQGGIYPGFEPTPRWRSEVPSGEMTTIGSHALITAMKIMRSPVRQVFAVTKQDFYRQYAAVQAEDYALMNLQFASGAVANLTVGRLPYRIPGEDIVIELTGTAGYARLNGPKFELWPQGVKEELPADPPQVTRETFSAFLEALDQGAEVPVTLIEGEAMQNILAAALESSRCGQVVEVAA